MRFRSLLKYSQPINALVILALVTYAVVGSIRAVHGPHVPDPKTDYAAVLDHKEADLLRAERTEKNGAKEPSVKKELMLVLWQNMKFREAGKRMRARWDELYPLAQEKYSLEFVDNGLNLASVYLDGGGFAEAQNAYEKILAYDKQMLPADDPRIARDYNNLGLSYFLRAQKEKEIVKRKKLIDSSLGCYELAEKMYRRSSIAKTQLLFNLQNQAVALAELGEDLPAQELNTAVNTRIEVENAFRQVFHWISIDAP